jgi:hypothetical protein
MAPQTAVQQNTAAAHQHLIEIAPRQLPLDQSHLIFMLKVQPEEEFGRGAEENSGAIWPHVQHRAHPRLFGKLPPGIRNVLTATSEDSVVHPGQVPSPKLSIQPPFDDGERADYTLTEEKTPTSNPPDSGGNSNGSYAIEEALILQTDVRHDV